MSVNTRVWKIKRRSARVVTSCGTRSAVHEESLILGHAVASLRDHFPKF
jgi:hypothetical protein